MNSSLIVAFLVAFCAGHGLALVWKDCSNPPGSLKNVDVQGCEDVDVCPITKGTNATVIFEFTPTAAANNATSVVHGIIAGVPVPFPLPNPDACHTEGSGLTCPLKASTAYTYTSSIPVEKSYPSISVTVKWELKDENSKDIFCAEMPVVIK